MRSIWQGLSFAFLLTSIACGGDDTVPAIGSGGPDTKNSDRRDSGDGDSRGDGGDAFGRDGGGDGGSIDVNPVAPVVKFLEPTAADDPNEDTLITTRTVKARCKVTRSSHPDAHPVDQSTVRIEATFAADPDRLDKLTVLTGAVDAEEDNVFVAEFTLSDVRNGAIDFACSANDTGMPPITGKATLHTLIDLGPSVEIIEPKDGAAHALKKVVQVKFRVTAAPVNDDDEEAKPTDIELVVSGQTIKFKEDSKDPGTYTASIDFDDSKLFPMTPNTAELVVTASNERTPDAPQRNATASISLDSKGPSLSITAPASMSIVGSEVVIQVRVTDPSGVKRDSLIGTIKLDGKVYKLEDWNLDGDTFSKRLDTRPFGLEPSQFTIHIEVDDEVGNHSETSVLLRRDTVAPLVSLDPPKIREYKMEGTTKICSEAFDPLGDDAVSDLDTAGIASMYRALVFERTNSAPDSSSISDYVSGVNDSTVVLYLQKRDVPLLIDTNNDGHCDEIDIEVEDDDGNDVSPTSLPLTALDARGSPYFSTATFDDTENKAADDCVVGTDLTPPGPLCPLLAMTRVITQSVEGGPRAIYASGKKLNGTTGGACEGDPWEPLRIVGEGWACLAARAEDNIGNVGVSAPLRVCFDDGNDGNGDPDCTSEPPSCVDDCDYDSLRFPRDQTLLKQ